VHAVLAIGEWGENSSLIVIVCDDFKPIILGFYAFWMS
jgi:hypothetical protein